MLANLAKDRLKADATANIQTALVLLGLSDFQNGEAILAVSVFAAHPEKLLHFCWQFKGFTTILSVKAIRHLPSESLAICLIDDYRHFGVYVRQVIS